jgi:N-acetylglucosamine malate deacetylase 1
MTKTDILAIGAHPDDVEMIVGGTLAKMIDRGRKVVTVDLTRGEMGTRGTPEVRAREAAAAAATLGVKERINLDMGDGVLEDTLKNRARLVEVIRDYRPAIVLCHYWKDLHPDHMAAGMMVQNIMYPLGFEKYPADGEPYRPNAFLFYKGHIPFVPSFVVDTSGYFEKKMEAIRSFSSQLHNANSDERLTGIAKPDFLLRIEARDRYFGSLIERTHGEPFKIKRAVPVDDPTELFAPFARV